MEKKQYFIEGEASTDNGVYWSIIIGTKGELNLRARLVGGTYRCFILEIEPEKGKIRPIGSVDPDLGLDLDAGGHIKHEQR